MDDKYIRLQDAQDILEMAIDDDWEMDYAIDRLGETPAADVVTRDCFDRILWENDIMRKQLADIGKSFGEKMDDVQKVVRGKWMRINQYDKESNVKCSACNEEFDYIDGICYLCIGHELPLFCPHCGADMRGFDNG